MGTVIDDKQVMNLYRGKAKTIRTQRCLGCNKALAFEVTNDIGKDGEYWIIDSALKLAGEVIHYFKRSGRWFGNPIQCPSCGRKGFMPMDKPLNWETMEQQRKEGKI